MKSTASFKDLCNRLRTTWQLVSRQTSGFAPLAVVSVIVCVVAGTALERQNSTDSKSRVLANQAPTHVQLTDWVAEYFACPKDNFEGSCRRVLQKQISGQYVVAQEKLPLGRGRYINNDQFSQTPTHVRLSHRISQTTAEEINKKWARERPSVVLSEQPVCDAGKCALEDLVVPFNRITAGGVSWLQFDAQIGSNGQFGPQSMPPLLVSASKAHQIFAAKSKQPSALFLELGVAILAPLFAFAFTIWAGKPRTYVAFSHLLTVKALWLLTAIDTLARQPIIFEKLPLKASFALTAFMTGWLFVAAMNFLSVAWSNKYLSRRATTTIATSVALIALISTYLVTPGTASAAMTLRAFEFATALTCTVLVSLALATLKQVSWRSRLAEFFRNSWRPEQGFDAIRNMKGTLVSFALSSALCLWVVFDASDSTFSLNWSTLLLPIMMTFVLLYARPQLTQADLQAQKDNVEQQEILVKLLSQIGTFRHRVQAISLVVNFCNRELPKLGFEAPQFLESQPSDAIMKNEDGFAVSIVAPVRSQHQTFGWIVARAKQRTESTAIGERIVDALSTALAQHLDHLIRTSLLESEANASQKFIPRDLVRFFGIASLNQLDSTQEFSLNGCAVSVVLRTVNNRTREAEMTPDRGIVNELTALFNKAANEFSGYMVSQEGLKWTLVFKDNPSSALRWIENTQNAIRNWNQHRQSLGMSLHECTFGANVSTIHLRFTEASGMLRPWIQCDLAGVAATLAEVGPEYTAQALLSQDLVSALVSGRGLNSLPDGVRPIDRVWNKSKTATVDIFEFFGGEPELRRASKQKSVELFSQGVKYYLAGHFDGARSILKQVVESDPNDKVAQRLLGNLSQNDDLRAA